jgi:hypothetical protein
MVPIEQKIIETKAFCGKQIEDIVQNINIYINNRPANVSPIQYINTYYFVTINILSSGFFYPTTYVASNLSMGANADSLYSNSAGNPAPKTETNTK